MYKKAYKRRRKKKRVLPLIIIMITVFIVLLGVVYIYKKAQDSNKKKPEDSSVSDSYIPDSSVTDSSEASSETDSKVEESSYADSEDDAISAFANLSYFNSSYIDRYKAYKKLNSNLPYEQAILHVNIGLDHPFYTNTYEADNYKSVAALVNKYSYLPSTYTPDDLQIIPSEFSDGERLLRKDAAEAFVKMCTDAKKQGYSIKAISTYRSYSYQKTLYDRYVSQDGKQAADTYSARAGHSEHQTGLVADIRGSQYYYEQFEKEKENKFILENAHKYGFIVRYPAGKENITGYMAEPWHLRYVGVDIAQTIKNENITFDEYCAKYGN